jgi:hypothetical protein
MAAPRNRAPYRWDVFISYPRRDGIRRWVAGVLQPQLEEELQNVGLGGVSVFRDDEDLNPGDIWPAKLSEEHAHSRIVLAILCHAYFESAWCCSEWQTAAARDKARSLGAIVPVRFNDLVADTLEQLPPVWRKDVAKRKPLNLEPYTKLVNRLADTECAHSFRREMATFCEGALKSAILDAPPRNSDWPRMPTDPIIRKRPMFHARFRAAP